MALRVSAVPHSENGRWVSRSEQVAEIHDVKEESDAYYRLKAQGKAVADQTLLDSLARDAQSDADLAAQIQSQFGGGGGDGGAAGASGGGGSGASGDGSSSSGADGGTGGGSGSGGSGDGGSGGGPGGAAGDP